MSENKQFYFEFLSKELMKFYSFTGKFTVSFQFFYVFS